MLWMVEGPDEVVLEDLCRHFQKMSILVAQGFPWISPTFLASPAIDLSTAASFLVHQVSTPWGFQNGDRHEVIALAKHNLSINREKEVFELLSTRMNTHFLRPGSVLKELDRDEHVQVFHVDYALLGCVNWPSRRHDSRGKSTHFDCSNSSGDTSVMLITCIEAPETTTNSFSSGLTVEVDAAAHCNLGLKNVASFSRYVPSILYKLLAHCQAAFLASSSARNLSFGSLSANVSALGLRWCLCPPWIPPRDGPNCSQLLMSLYDVLRETPFRFSSGWTVSRSQVQPFVLAIRRSVTHTNVWSLHIIATVASSDFWDSKSRWSVRSKRTPKSKSSSSLSLDDAASTLMSRESGSSQNHSLCYVPSSPRSYLRVQLCNLR